jgi:hypothetical protein
VPLAKQTNSLENGSGHVWAVAREMHFDYGRSTRNRTRMSNAARFITGCILPVSGGAELGYRL